MSYLNSLKLALISLTLAASALGAVPSRLLTSATEERDDAPAFTAIVKQDKARFVFPLPARSEWRWREKSTKDNAMEYRYDVTVRNNGDEYTFGFYLWKRAGSDSEHGSLRDLIEAGQKSLFQVLNTRHATIIRDAGVKVKLEGGKLVVIVEERKNVERLFSSHPAEVTFKILIPGEAPVTQAVAVTYQN